MKLATQARQARRPQKIRYIGQWSHLPFTKIPDGKIVSREAMLKGQRVQGTNPYPREALGDLNTWLCFMMALLDLPWRIKGKESGGRSLPSLVGILAP